MQTRHRAIRDKLIALGYRVPALNLTMSNLEYVTVAEDELAPNSTTAIRGHLAAVATHAQGVVATAKTQLQALAAPAATAYAGFPEADFMAWIEDGDKAAMQPLINAFKEDTRDELTLQATVGVIPSAIPALFKSRTSLLTPSDVFQDAADRVHETVKGLLDYEPFRQNPWVADLKGHHSIDYQGFVGMLYMICSYIVGNAINRTDLIDGSSVKNAVPFMSKLVDLGVAMETSVPARLRALGVDLSVIPIIHHYFWACEYARPDYWKREWDLHDRAVARGGVIGIPATFVPRCAHEAAPRHHGQPAELPRA